jgi:hypothetical protein
MKTKDEILIKAIKAGIGFNHSTEDTTGAETEYQRGYMQGYADANRDVDVDELIEVSDEQYVSIWSCIDMISTSVLCVSFGLNFVGALTDNGALFVFCISLFLWIMSYICKTKE